MFLNADQINEILKNSAEAQLQNTNSSRDEEQKIDTPLQKDIERAMSIDSNDKHTASWRYYTRENIVKRTTSCNPYIGPYR
jgi:hypothetical protein